MELGQKIKAARLEQGLSQRQLCGDTITRNMLSQIENGSARPSMDTLAYLASKLGKTVSFFLEEHPASPNQAIMEQARLAFVQKEFIRVQSILEAYRAPDAVFDWEKDTILAGALTALALTAAESGRKPYALRLLAEAEEAGKHTPYFDMTALQLAYARLGEPVQLPDVDEVLFLKARRAAEEGDTQKACALLDAMDCHADARWMLLRGELLTRAGQWEQAKELLLAAESAFPQETVPLLEACYSALEDYKMAYLYACRQKKT